MNSKFLLTELLIPVFCVNLLFSGARLATGQVPDSVDKDYSSELPRIAPRSPEEALESFQVLPGFKIELVAAEPLVFDPIAFAFDAQERLFVVEMKDYSEQDTEHLGSIALLTDNDGDGRMDQRTVFAEGLSWPTAIWPWRDGVVVAAPPKLTWFRDTDQDGVSDQQEEWFVGFGRSNVQGMCNSLRWGVDGYLHGATSSTGAELNPLQSDQGAVRLRRRDFKIDPIAKTIRPSAGGGQHGLSFNAWGDKFVTSNSDHLQQVVELDEWMSSHPSRVPFPALRRSIAADGPQAEVYRKSPVEPWRIVRTRLRVSGVVKGIVEGGGRAAGYFTGATGTHVVDAHMGFGAEEMDTALVCDVGSNLIHRKRLVDQGLFWRGERIDEESELVTSEDIWFRPVQLGDGPDGAVYVADMYREVIEHPKSLPPMIKKHLDLTSGRDRGRIWRLRPASSETSRADKRLAECKSQELVANLNHSIAWRRRTASQLLVERQLDELGIQALVSLIESPKSAKSQILALHVAHRQGVLTADMLQAALASNHPRVLQHAIDVARIGGHLEPCGDQLAALGGHDDARVQLALAQAAADMSDSRKRELLTAVRRKASEPLVMATVLSAAAADSWKIVQDLPQAELANSRRWVEIALSTWLVQSKSDEALNNWLWNELNQVDEGGLDWIAVIAAHPSSSDLAVWLSSLGAKRRDELDRIVGSRLRSTPTAINLIRLAGENTKRRWASEALSAGSTVAAQQAAVKILVESGESTGELIGLLPELTPVVQAEALRLIVGRNESAALLLDAIESGEVPPAIVPQDLRQTLQSGDLRERASKTFARVSDDRRAVIRKYLSVLESVGEGRDAVAGATHFKKVCAQCHRLKGIGNDVGAALANLQEKTPEQLLVAILDPNREIDPRYMSYSVLLVDGRIITGVIREESASAVLMIGAGGEQHRILRSEIDQLRSTGQSLMPNGLEQQLDATQMTQLIDYLRSGE